MLQLLRKISGVLRIRPSYALWKDGYLVHAGWFISFQAGRPVNSKGEPIPWIPYSATEFIESKLNKQMTVFEFGAGYSTLWWAGKVKRVDSYEHNELWFDEISKLVPENVRLYYCGGNEYFSRNPELLSCYDIIFVDGQKRPDCIDLIMQISGNTSVIIWDDSQLDEYKDAFQSLYNAGFKRIFFSGIGPVINTRKETSLFYRENNCFNI